MKALSMLLRTCRKTLGCRAMLCLLAVLSGCSASEMTTVTYDQEVEIAPNRWLVLKRKITVPKSDISSKGQDPHKMDPATALQQIAKSSGSKVPQHTSRFECVWNDATVEWMRKGTVPISLREHDGRLYMIGLDRSDVFAMKFVFFRLDGAKKAFEIVDASVYPPEIATQNMWLNPGDRYVNTDSGRVDTWSLLRELDINHPVFPHTYTAQIWYQIDRNVEFSEMGLIEKDFLQQYVHKHKPIALPTIVKEDSAETEAATPE